MNKISPCLWFNDNAEAAVAAYLSLFSNSRKIAESRYTAETAAMAGLPEGSVMTITFEIEGQTFMALNGGPHYQFTPAVSLMIDCQDQKEIDHLWDGLSDGGQTMDCGWVTDRFGVSWQVLPSKLNEMMADSNPVKVKAVTEAMLKMSKLDIAALELALDQAG